MPLPLLLFLLLGSAIASAATTATHPDDLAALKAFHASILPSSIPPWSCLASWDFAVADPCALPRAAHFTCGISCGASPSSPHARVLSLSLDPAGYTSRGAIGPLPPALLHLDLSSNSFPGPLPRALPPSLISLALSSASLSGPLPGSLPRNLTTLDLARNSFTGPIPPGLLASLASLRTLDLSFNSLRGALPPTLPASLASLALRGNRLSGPLLASTFLPLRRLEIAELGANAFSGAFPLWFLHLPSLQQVDVANNSFSRFDLGSRRVGGGNRDLVAVDLGFNLISGYLPVELAGFGRLTALSLRHNRLTGAIPWEYFGAKKGKPFLRLFLDGNFLNGKVPSGFMAAGNLAGSFADNCLEGCSAGVALCGAAQKPADVCREVYGRGTSRGNRRAAVASHWL